MSKNWSKNWSGRGLAMINSFEEKSSNTIIIENKNKDITKISIKRKLKILLEFYPRNEFYKNLSTFNILSEKQKECIENNYQKYKNKNIQIV